MVYYFIVYLTKKTFLIFKRIPYATIEASAASCISSYFGILRIKNIFYANHGGKSFYDFIPAEKSSKV